MKKSKKNQSIKKNAKSKSKSRRSTSARQSADTNDENPISEDVATLILQDHKPLKQLIAVLKDEDESTNKKREAYDEFAWNLFCHAKAEEGSLYVCLKNEDDLRIEGLEAETEHMIAEQLMNEVNQIRNDEELWCAKVKVLAEVVEHHIKEEEKNVLKEVRKEFNSEERKQIGEDYARLLSRYRQGQENGARETALESTHARDQYVW